MNRFADIEALVAVVESGSFSAAADRMGIAKSALSRRIALLEKRLDARLLNRTTRQLSLTDAGRAFYDRAVRLLHDLEEAEQEVSSEHATLSGKLKVAAPLSFGLMHLKSVVNAFLRDHEGVHIELDLNDRQIDLVEEGFDMALSIGRLTDSTLIARRLTNISRVTVAGPTYLKARGVPRHPDDLVHHSGLRYTNISRRDAWTFKSKAGEKISASIPERFRTNNGLMLADAVEAGLGIASLPTLPSPRAPQRALPTLIDAA
jgi:DNA-binding transcriptional LysR family regulator